MKHSSYTPKWNGPCQSSTQHKEAGSASTHPENLETRKSFVCPTTDFMCFMSLHWCWILKPMQQSTKTTASVLQPYPLCTLLLHCQVLSGTMLGMCSLPTQALLSTLVMLSAERTCSKRKASKFPTTPAPALPHLSREAREKSQGQVQNKPNSCKSSRISWSMFLDCTLRGF